MDSKHLLIEGWRGVNHSFALVNQCQILELHRLSGLRLFHRDLPFAMAHWNAKSHGAGFSAADSAVIDGLREPAPGERVDCVLRISSPFRAEPTSPVQTLTFMVTELGLSDKSFEPGSAHSAAFTRDANLIVTPTAWSRDRLVDYGFEAGRIRIVTHGVNTDTFHPLSVAERAGNRANLGLAEDETVFLNLGVATWNKGLDLVLMAFARLRRAGRRVRLILKDQRGLYGISVEQVLKDVCTRHPELFTADTLGAIQVVSVNLSQAELRLLYGIADCYVSAYRAEGFNLPVLEAIACGTPVVVTDGGATDDFCGPGVALRVASDAGSREDRAAGMVARYREPRLDHLIECMDRFVQGSAIGHGTFESARVALMQAMTWRRAAEDLRALIA
ncbi:glycosyltransferase [Aquabacterium sp. A7-Y]|uniref:glycosyltransferase n=1 Tax=Aquabacterium sp. A7-Y TaxID=1349605 RepID=UPI00223CED74|nr:glycosyltransferase [Aquabacterium sp. A7-Y]MCW7541858.1 glycosyltransferase [Aquabacterium sp. A7-Y]